MRLTPHEIDAIKTAAAEAFGDDAVVRLFGSRLDDSLRGGDVDLHVEAGTPIDEWRARERFEQSLFRNITPRKVDLVISARGGQPRGFERIAYRDGVIL